MPALPHKRSPDGATTDWGGGHLIAAYYYRDMSRKHSLSTGWGYSDASPLYRCKIWDLSRSDLAPTTCDKEGQVLAAGWYSQLATKQRISTSSASPIDSLDVLVLAQWLRN